MKLQISSRIAICALLELAARPDRQVSVAEVGEKYGISSHHLAKVMHTLARAGLVRSVRGAGGGYIFAGHARRTTLLDVIRLFENIGAGDGANGEQTAEERALGRILGEIDDIAGATLGSVTLATVLKLVERERQPVRAARATKA
jgi:Rrf2 family protein